MLSSNILDRLARNRFWLFGVPLFLNGLACAAENASGIKGNVAFVYECEEKTRAICLVGTFPSGKKVALVSADGRQCSATTKDSFGYEGAVDKIPVTRLDTTRCQGPDFAFAWLSPEKGTVQVIKPPMIEDKVRLSEIEKAVSRTGLIRFDERKWREKNPEPLNNETWLRQMEDVKMLYSLMTGPLRAYRLTASDKEGLMLRYRTKGTQDQGPLLLLVGGAVQLLNYQASSPVAFEIGNRKYLFFSWSTDGGHHGSSVWEIGEKRAREVLMDDSFST